MVLSLSTKLAVDISCSIRLNKELLTEFSKASNNRNSNKYSF